MITPRKIAGIAIIGGASLTVVGCAQPPNFAANGPYYRGPSYAPPAQFMYGRRSYGTMPIDELGPYTPQERPVEPTPEPEPEKAIAKSHQLAPYVEGAAVGAIGGVLAGQAMAARQVGGQVAKGALSAEARAAAIGAETAARRATAAGAAGAGAVAVGTAQTAGGGAVLGRALLWTVRKSLFGFAVLTAGEILLHESKTDGH